MFHKTYVEGQFKQELSRIVIHRSNLVEILLVRETKDLI